MSRSLGNTIADSLRLSLGYAERLLSDVPADRFARFANPGGQTVNSNHPAFIYGHLSLYAPQMVQQMGGDASKITPPDRYSDLFSKDATCQDDVDGTIYPAKDEITSALFEGYAQVLECLGRVDDDTLQQANPLGGTFAEKFPTIGSMHAFYVGGHMMIHFGQMSAWRRMIGLGSA